MTNEEAAKDSKTLSYYNFKPVGSSSLSGGFLCAWKDNLDILVTNVTERYIELLVQASSSTTSWSILLLYGSPSWGDRADLWESIINSKSYLRGAPWILLGDLNDLVRLEDYVGPNHRARLSHHLKNLIDFFALSDLRYSGPYYNWSNKQTGRRGVCERLDRGLASLEWLNWYP
uniref:Endonuclease/exonuclease/phosphatase domain-containing protein n=1 Tax=Nelumbo nucifera TaxID=4432 RepID=A0A822XGB6_NELNU|nr:TPA_asm: hypothetical protein HUJ06_020186 [Nelumbo nucifera]